MASRIKLNADINSGMDTDVRGDLMRLRDALDMVSGWTANALQRLDRLEKWARERDQLKLFGDQAERKSNAARN